MHSVVPLEDLVAYSGEKEDAHKQLLMDPPSTRSGFQKGCLDFLQTNTQEWTFARITSVPNPATADKYQDAHGNTCYSHYYGFAEELYLTNSRPPKWTPRNIWFKLASHTKEEIQIGPMQFGTPEYNTLPIVGDIVVGKVVHNLHQTGFRFEWWCREAHTLMYLVRVCCHNQMDAPDVLCTKARLPSCPKLDNIWAFIRLVMHEDLEPFIQQYREENHRSLHPIRKDEGPRGYVLDRSPHRFVLDVAKVCCQPQVYAQFLDRVAQLQETDDVLHGFPSSDELRQYQVELQELESTYFPSDTCYAV